MINKIITFSALAAIAFSLVTIPLANAAQLRSLPFLWLYDSPNGFQYLYQCTGYYYLGASQFFQVNCYQIPLSYAYYYCNEIVLYQDGNTYFWGSNNACGHVAGINPNANPIIAANPASATAAKIHIVSSNAALLAAQKTLNDANNRSGLGITTAPPTLPSNLPHR